MNKRIKNMIVVMGFIPALFIGTAPVALADSISNTGPNSDQTISTVNLTNTTVLNNNNVTIINHSTQTAISGNATVSGNTTGGSATTGNASNANATDTTVKVNNLSALVVPSAGGDNSSISNTGPDSNNTIRNIVSNNSYVLNNNNVMISNHNNQFAKSGNATVSGNTTGGNATTGNASNANATCVSVQINNGGLGNVAADNTCAPAPTQPVTGGKGGGVLGASATLASVLTGGKGGGFDQLPNTGAKDDVSAWFIATVLILMSSVAYWRLAITPKLKAL